MLPFVVASWRGAGSLDRKLDPVIRLQATKIRAREMRFRLRSSHTFCSLAVLAGILLSNSASAGNVFGKVTGVKAPVQIVLKGGAQNKHFNVRTNENGEYSVFLPQGRYEASVNGKQCSGEVRSYDFPARQDINC